METVTVNLDLFISALIHDLGKVSIEYYLSKEPCSNILDSHAHILVDKYPHIKDILNIPTLWAPEITYLDIMTRHHDSYVTGALRKFKEADRKNHAHSLSFPPPTDTRRHVRKYLIQIDYFGNIKKCNTSSIPQMQKELIKHLSTLISGNINDKVRVIQTIYKPILSLCPTDNRPGYSISIWNHSVSVYMHLKSSIPKQHPLKAYSHPETQLFHPYGDMKLWMKMMPYYSTILEASADSLIKRLSNIRSGIKKHISNLSHTSENHRLFFIDRNIKMLIDIANPHKAQEIEHIFRHKMGLAKPPSIQDIAIKLIKAYLSLRYKYGYTHEGALFYIFFIRKISLADILQIQQARKKGPLSILLGTPTSNTCIYKSIVHNPLPWIYSSRDHGIPIKEHLYITDREHHILVNSSEIFLKGIGPKRNGLAVHSKYDTGYTLGRNSAS